MRQRYTLLSSLLISSVSAIAQGGGCFPPVVLLDSPGEPTTICQGGVVGFDGGASTAAPGHFVDRWVWHVGADRDTTEIGLAVFPFPDPGVFEVTLEVLDEVGCSSGESDPVHVLVSATPDFSGTLVPQTACEGQTISLNAVAQQPLMIGDPVACTPPNNGTPLLDSPSISTSTLQVSGQPNGTVGSVAELGDICLEMEHSFMSDLVLTVTCPNGQSVILHNRGGGGTFLGDAFDSDNGNTVIPGTCFQYCFGLAPEFPTLAAAMNNTVPVSQGTARTPGRYTSLQPLEQLVGCPFNGTWTFTSADMAGSDNGFLCGWCISFGEQPDSSFIGQGPILGSSPDSSFWSGPGITNTTGQPGSAVLEPVSGTQFLTYTVIDSYGCEHEAQFPISVGSTPEVSIEENSELGLICAQPTGAFSYQWSYQDQVVIGAAGACFTPPGPGSVSVVVITQEGCSGSAILLNTGVRDAAAVHESAFSVYPNPNAGSFNLLLTGRDLDHPVVRIVDMTGRLVIEQRIARLVDGVALPTAFDLASGTYVAEVVGEGERLHQCMVVH